MMVLLLTINEKLQYLKNYRNFIDSEIKNITKEEIELNNKFIFLKDEIEESLKLEQLVKKISEYYSEIYLKSLENFINDGLNFIFDDRDYKVEIEVIDRKVEKEINFLLVENGMKTKMTSIGSGIKCVISFLIQIFIIEKMNGGKYLFLDESFTEVANDYIDNLFTYIKKLVKELGFSILLVSHLEEHKKYFNKTYEVSGGFIHEI
jgi:hypothetical protein